MPVSLNRSTRLKESQLLRLDGVCEVSQRVLRRLLCCVWIIAFVSHLKAADDAGLKRSLTTIFGEDVLQDNLRHVIKHTFTLPEPDRFDALADWVLPSTERPGYRLSCDYDSDPEYLAVSRTSTIGGDASGGFLISPALHVVELARRLHRLDELRTRVEESDVTGEV